MLQWQRIYRLYGIRPFGLILAVVLVFALILDKEITSCIQIGRQHNSLKAELAKKNAKIAELPELERLMERVRTRFNMIGSRLVTAETPEAVNLVGPMTAWMSGYGIRDVSGWAPPPVDTRESTLVNARMSGKLLPQNLVTLLRQLSRSPVVVYVPEMEIKVTDPTEPNQLEAMIRFETSYVPPPVAEVESVKARKVDAGSGNDAPGRPAAALQSEKQRPSGGTAGSSGTVRRGAATKTR